MNPNLKVKKLCQKLQKRTILNNITLDFNAGIIHGLLGPNGSGKSTLLKTLAGIWPPVSGEILWNNNPFLNQDRRLISRTISLVMHDPHIYFDFLVQDIVAMGRYPHNAEYWHKTESDFVEQALNEMDVWHLRKRVVTQLSQGEKQRVYIARALATESPILLLDEPTANLDLQHQLQIWNLLQKLVEKGKIVIVTTHDLMTAHHFCEEIAVLHHGNCLGQGPYSSQLSDKVLKEVFGLEKATRFEPLQYGLKKK